MRLFLILFLFTGLYAESKNADSIWCPKGAEWYYKNEGSGQKKIKFIHVVRIKDTIFIDNSKYNLLIFYYLDSNGKEVQHDSLYTRYINNAYVYIDTKGSPGRIVGWKTYKFGDDFISHNAFTSGVYSSSSQPVALTTCVKINGFRLTKIIMERLNPKYAFQTPFVGDFIGRIGSLFYFMPVDTYHKNCSGGRLLWYYDPQFGRYVPDSTKEEEDTCGKITDVEEAELHSPISLYPNPAKEVLNISVNNLSRIIPNTSLSITDITGKVILRQPYTSSINIAPLPKGMYILSLQTKERLYHYKFLKE